jgi:hypothetical protein
MKRLFFVLIMLPCICGVASASDCETTATDWDTWRECRISMHSDIESAQKEQTVNATATAGTINSSSKSTMDPSIQTNSTSLVDTTSTPDLLGFASHIAKLDSKASGGQQDSFSFYTTAYAFYAGIQRVDPLDPAFYVSHQNWRRISVFMGREVPDDKSSAAVGPGNLFGFKVLFINHRDLGRPENIKMIQEQIIPVLYTGGIAKGQLDKGLKKLLGITTEEANLSGNDFVAMITKKVSDKELSVDTLVVASLKEDSPITLEHKAIQQVYDKIRTAKQLSLNFQGKKRDYSTAADEYRIEGAFDSGLASRWDLSINAGANYLDEKTLGPNSIGGRIAAQGSWRLTEDQAAPNPWVIYFSGAGRWLTNTGPTYEVQLKSSVPLYNGVNIPISFTWANKSTLVQEAHIISGSNFKSKFGFTLDVSKLLSKSQ